MKKKYLIIAVIILILLSGFCLPYKYSNEDAVRSAKENILTKSKCMCAWYVMGFLHHGGCYPCGIYPAYAYERVLPSLGFREVSENVPQKGDVVVLTRNSKSPFGHIAIYDGTQWISDFRQKSLFPSETYRLESSYKIFRQSDGWHTANIWFNPKYLFEYSKSFVIWIRKKI